MTAATITATITATATGKPRPLIAGNWKMNGTSATLGLARSIAAGINADARAEVVLCPPATLIASVAAAVRDSAVAIGGQDCHVAAKGAHTGDVAAEMLADAGATHVILGHSERRTDHGESDELVRDKVRAAHRAGLVAIVCVGETRAQREAGEALSVVGRQLRTALAAIADDAAAARLVVAYEPVWAIGTGLTPTLEDIAEVHAAIRAILGEAMSAAARDATRILYGGSVKPGNAAEILAVDHVDGALVGGASLVADDFLAIVEACPR